MIGTMRSLALGVFLALFAPLAVAVQIFTAASLSGPAENPPNSSPGIGQTTVILDTTTHRLRVQVSFAGLTSNTTMAHIHCCTTAPGNVGVASTVPAFVGFPLGVTSGTMDQTYDTLLPGTWNAAFITNNGGTPAGAEAALAAGLAAGRAYLNIHTVNFGPGEIRGFLLPQVSQNIDNIPTLSQWGLAGLAIILAVATWFVMRRRMR